MTDVIEYMYSDLHFKMTVLNTAHKRKVDKDYIASSNTSVSSPHSYGQSKTFLVVTIELKIFREEIRRDQDLIPLLCF